jgi:hypothetical protein
MKMSAAQFFGQADRVWRIILISALFLAMLIRLFYLINIASQPFLDMPIGYSADYVNEAASLGQGEPGGLKRLFLSSPLYLELLTGLLRLFGPDLLFPRFLQMLLGISGALLLWFLAAPLLGRLGAALCLIFALFYLPAIFYEGIIIDSSLNLFLTILLLLVMRRSWISWVWPALAGLIMGGVILTRPNSLICLPLLTGWLIMREWPSHRGFRLAGIWLALTIITISPFTIRNRLQSGEWILISSSGGINFFIGNNPAANGGFNPPPEINHAMEAASLKLAGQLSGRDLTPGQASRFWFQRGKRFIQENPAAAIRLWWEKWRLLWDAVELPNVANLYFVQKFCPVLRLPLVTFGWLAPLAWLGLITALPLWRHFSLFYLWLIGSIGSILPFFIIDRLRLPLLPGLFLFAAYGLGWFLIQARQRNWRKLSAALVFLLLFGIWNHQGQIPQDFSNSYNNQGVVYYRLGDMNRARQAFEQALTDNPGQISALQNLIMLSRAAGDSQRVEELTRQLDSTRKKRE